MIGELLDGVSMFLLYWLQLITWYTNTYLIIRHILASPKPKNWKKVKRTFS
jgi:hypothetical protein